MNLNPFKRKQQVVAVGSPLFIPVSWAQDFLSNALGVNEAKYFEYYCQVPELQAVINYRANCLASMNVKARRIEGDDIDKDPALDLLKQPNDLMSFAEFVRQYSIYRDLTGNSYIYTLYGTTVEKTQALWQIPPFNVTIKAKENVNQFTSTDYKEIINGYEVTIGSKKIIFKPEEVIHFFDSIIQSNKELTLKGVSKIQPLTQLLQNIKVSYEARGIILGNSPLGMITNDSQDAAGTVPLDPKEKKEVQDAMRGYGTSAGKYSYLISSAKLKWQGMASSVTTQHFDEVTNDLRSICNAYAFPPDLLLAGSTYENIKEAKKQLYQDSIIPQANDFLQGISSGLGLLGRGVELYADFSHIAVLQDDYEKQARTWNVTVMALNKAYADQAITLQQYQDALTKVGLI